MKVLGSLILLLCLHGAYAQSRTALVMPNHNRCFKINPLSFIIGSLTLHYEQTVSAEKAVTASVNLINLGYRGYLYGFGVGGGLRSYFSGTGKNSFFVEPFIKYIYITDINNSGNVNSFGMGLTGGRKWILAQRLTLDIFGGPLISKGFLKSGVQPANPYSESLGPLNGIWFKGGITIGYQFK